MCNIDTMECLKPEEVNDRRCAVFSFLKVLFAFFASKWPESTQTPKKTNLQPPWPESQTGERPQWGVQFFVFFSILAPIGCAVLLFDF